MAYGRTFLQLVNEVLRELREDEVSNWNASAYSTMVGGWINSCKRDAEAAWRWNDLRTDVTVPTVAGTALYSITGTNPRTQLLEVWNDTSNYQLDQRKHIGSRQARYTDGSVQSGLPTDYVLEAMHATTGELQVRLYPQPNSVESLVYHVYLPTEDLAANDTVLTIPYKAIVEGAVARARYERGEDGGVSFADQAAFMRTKLADDIAVDAQRHPENLIWEPV